jgi:hypothetical protein
MSLFVPDLTVTLQQRRLACVLDPALLLSPYGLAMSRLGDVLELWVVRELWHMLDNTHFYAQHPALLVEATAHTTDTDVAAQEALQALLDWERWRLDSDQASLKLFWVGDEPSGSLLPTHMDASIVWRYEMLASALEGQTSSTDSTEQALTPAFRDAVALAAALRTSLILVRLPQTAEPDHQIAPRCVCPVPPLCQALVQWGVACTLLSDYDPLVHIEREYLRQVLVHAGLTPLLWAGLRLAVMHLWVPGASTLWPEPRAAGFAGLDELATATDAALPPAGQLWQAAQGFWYVL